LREAQTKDSAKSVFAFCVQPNDFRCRNDFVSIDFATPNPCSFQQQICIGGHLFAKLQFQDLKKKIEIGHFKNGCDDEFDSSQMQRAVMEHVCQSKTHHKMLPLQQSQ